MRVKKNVDRPKKLKLRKPLPYSAVPKELAFPIGAMTVAYQSIEDEVAELLENVTNIAPAVLKAFLSRIWQISARLDVVVELLVEMDRGEAERLRKLVQRIREVGQQRNAFMHSATDAFNKTTGEIWQVNRKRKNAPVGFVGLSDLNLLVNRMYLVIEAMHQRRLSDGRDWDQPLMFWDNPSRFWKSSTTAAS